MKASCEPLCALMALSERSPIRAVESPQTLTGKILMKNRALCSVGAFRSINGIGAAAGCRGTVRDYPAFRYATPRSHTGCKRLSAVTPSNRIILCSALCGFDPTLISVIKRNGTKIGPKRDGSHKNAKNASEICDFHRVRG